MHGYALHFVLPSLLIWPLPSDTVDGSWARERKLIPRAVHYSTPFFQSGYHPHHCNIKHVQGKCLKSNPIVVLLLTEESIQSIAIGSIIAPFWAGEFKRTEKDAEREKRPSSVEMMNLTK